MAAATYDLKDDVGALNAKTAPMFVARKRIDCSVNNIGLGESAEFITIPAKTVVTRVDAILRTPEGGTLTIDIGDEGNPDAWNDGGNANGTADLLIATGTAAANAAGYYYDTATGLRLTCVNAADTAVIDIVVVGYHVEDRATG